MHHTLLNTIPVTNKLKSRLSSFLFNGFELKKTKGSNINGTLILMSFRPASRLVVVIKPKRCIINTELKIQKILFLFSELNFSLKFPSKIQLLNKMICGILVGTVPNNMAPPMVQIPNKKIYLWMAGENIDLIT